MSFQSMTDSAINRHGMLSKYVAKSTGDYDVETGTVINTETEYSIKVYRKHIKANQYNFPNLIGKDIALFYLSAGQLTFVPNVQDLIIYNSETYKVDSIQSHTANGAVILYRVVGVK